MALWKNTDTSDGKPKYLSSDDATNTVGIDAAEASANGLTAGWNLKTVGTGGREGRVFHEVLVAMGSMTGDNDTVDPDPVITIGTQPSPVSVTSPTAATFTVVATATRGAALSYQWQVSPNGAAWANITGATAATLTLEDGDVGYVDGNYFRVVVSATGATTVNSSAVQVTIS
jgi:hypothetical protein